MSTRGACPPHGTERCEHCGYLPIIRIWTDRRHALWDEHPGDLISRRNSPNARDQEIPLSRVRDKHGPLVIMWHADDACPPGCTLPGAASV